jgi:hypothetical protein
MIRKLARISGPVHAHQPARARQKSGFGYEAAMVEKSIISSRNVVDLSRYRELNAAGRAMAMTARMCRHCGAALLDGEREEECSSTFNLDVLGTCFPPRRFVAD